MKRARVTLIPGDGIGPEITRATTYVIEKAGGQVEWDEQLGGKAAVQAVGNPMPDALLASIKKNRVALKGPLETDVGRGYRSINVTLRKYFDLYANLRPVNEVTNLKWAPPEGKSASDIGAGIQRELQVKAPMNCQSCHR